MVVGGRSCKSSSKSVSGSVRGNCMGCPPVGSRGSSVSHAVCPHFHIPPTLVVKSRRRHASLAMMKPCPPLWSPMASTMCPEGDQAQHNPPAPCTPDRPGRFARRSHGRSAAGGGPGVARGGARLRAVSGLAAHPPGDGWRRWVPDPPRPGEARASGWGAPCSRLASCAIARGPPPWPGGPIGARLSSKCLSHKAHLLSPLPAGEGAKTLHDMRLTLSWRIWPWPLSVGADEQHRRGLTAQAYWPM